jgi:hypothetical protein
MQHAGIGTSNPDIEDISEVYDEDRKHLQNAIYKIPTQKTYTPRALRAGKVIQLVKNGVKQKATAGMVTGFMLLLLPFLTAQAEDFTAEAKVFKTIFNNSTYAYETVKDNEGVQVNFGYKSLYLFLSAEDMNIYGVRTNILGAGLGIKIPIVKGLSAFGQAGYYYILDNGNSSVEILGSELNHRLAPDYPPTKFDYYKLDSNDTWGGTVGVDYNYNFTKSISLGISVAYRFMSIHENVKGYYSTPHGSCPAYGGICPANQVYWQAEGNHDVSGAQIGIGAKIEF